MEQRAKDILLLGENTELKELTEKTLKLFEIDDISKLSLKLMQTVINNDVNKYSAFVNYVEDLSVDWLQKIFQYIVWE